jgi:asparagine synthetase B (glutamine-hydrolysing)
VAGSWAPVLRPEVDAAVRLDERAAQRYADAQAEVPRLPGEDAGERRIREALYHGLTRWLPMLLDRKDRLSMAVGLEVRVPFCDHRPVEYVWNVPWRLKQTGGIEGTGGVPAGRERVADRLPGGSRLATPVRRVLPPARASG